MGCIRFAYCLSTQRAAIRVHVSTYYVRVQLYVFQYKSKNPPISVVILKCHHGAPDVAVIWPRFVRLSCQTFQELTGACRNVLGPVASPPELIDLCLGLRYL